jgi:hypothetical protein
MDAHSGADALIAHVVGAVESARTHETPFFHLQLDGIFPGNVYAEMMNALPASTDYRALPGRNNSNIRQDGSSTRVKIDLFPEYIRHLPAAKRRVWEHVGRALCSDAVREAFMRRLAPPLERRFGPGHGSVGLYPIPVLTRDIPGYRIPPHTDTNSICRATRPTPISARFFTAAPPTAPSRATRRCGSRLIRAMPSRSAPIAGIRPTRCRTTL